MTTFQELVQEHYQGDATEAAEQIMKAIGLTRAQRDILRPPLAGAVITVSRLAVRHIEQETDFRNLSPRSRAAQGSPPPTAASLAQHPLLSQTMFVPGHAYVRWGDMTLELISIRQAYLRNYIAGVQKSIDTLEDAARVLRETGANTLFDVPESLLPSLDLDEDDL